MSRSVTLSLTVGTTEFSVAAPSRRLAHHLGMHLHETRYYNGRDLLTFMEDNFDEMVRAVGITELSIMNMLITEQELLLTKTVVGEMLDKELAYDIKLSLYYCD